MSTSSSSSQRLFRTGSVPLVICIFWRTATKIMQAICSSSISSPLITTYLVHPRLSGFDSYNPSISNGDACLFGRVTSRLRAVFTMQALSLHWTWPYHLNQASDIFGFYFGLSDFSGQHRHFHFGSVQCLLSPFRHCSRFVSI